MSENRSSEALSPLDVLDGLRSPMSLCPADAAVLGGLLPLSPTAPAVAWYAPLAVPPAAPPAASPPAPPPAALLNPVEEAVADSADSADLADLAGSANSPAARRPACGPRKGSVVMNAARLRQLRESRLLSQQDLCEAIFDRNLQVSIATIKRAETGHAVRFRIVRALAHYFDVPPGDLL